MVKTLLRFLNFLYKNFTGYIFKYRSKVELPTYLDQVLIGLLLSDGSLEKSSYTSLPRLSVMFGSLHLPYLFYLYNLFEPYTGTGINILDIINKKTNKIYSEGVFKTVSLPCFLLYHKMFYVPKPCGKGYIKIVPSNINELMSPVVLAHLIMGDGNFKSYDGIIRIYTNSFTYEDVKNLAFSIKKNLNISVNVVHDRNNQYIITISRSQLNLVRRLLLSHMHPSMVYKLGLKYDDVKYQCFNLKNHLHEI